ncbi:unnamed protein product, partial [Nesidiocoris tenuis]
MKRLYQEIRANLTTDLSIFYIIIQLKENIFHPISAFGLAKTDDSPQDAISESNPRIIDDSRARKLANDLKRCSYYETCATYGLNVERVFQDACQKIVQLRLSRSNSSLGPSSSRPSTPIGISMPPPPQIVLPSSPVNNQSFVKENTRSIGHSLSTSSHALYKELTSENNNLSRLPTLDNLTLNPNMSAKDLPTPSSTPTAT